MVTQAPVAHALVESLRDDPFYQAISVAFGCDHVRRDEALFRYFDYSMSEGVRLGRCLVASEGPPAAAVWLLPAAAEQNALASRNKAAFLVEALGESGAANYHRIIDFMAPRAQAMVPDSAWYLSIIGVSPSGQGQGVGARLARLTLSEADAAGATCYLETFSPRNLRFYDRLGFRTVASHREPVTAEEYCIMERTPG